MHFLFSDIFERNKKVSHHNKPAIQSYDGVMVSVIVSNELSLLKSNSVGLVQSGQHHVINK